jgi:hypothetical protein
MEPLMGGGSLRLCFDWRERGDLGLQVVQGADGAPEVVAGVLEREDRGDVAILVDLSIATV